MWWYVVCGLGAYLVGGIPFGVLVARAKGIDLRRVGSGNIGATNVARALGKKAALMVFLLDGLKGALPVLGTLYFVATKGNVSAPILGVVVAVCAIAGHIFSPYVRFRGGKGVATGAGATAALLPLPLLLCAGVWVAVLLMFRYVSLASLCAAVALPVSSFLFGMKENDFWQANGVLFGYSLVLAALVVARHFANIKRLISGKEPKIGGKKESEGEKDIFA